MKKKVLIGAAVVVGLVVLYAFSGSSPTVVHAKGGALRSGNEDPTDFGPATNLNPAHGGTLVDLIAAPARRAEVSVVA